MGEIQLNNLTKKYGDLVAVDSIDVTIPDGSYTMILGPSGCGKSTTLRIIAGLETPTMGDVSIDNNIVTDLPPRKRDLSMVFQNLALWDHKTVRENIAFGLKMNDVSKAERNEQVERIAEILQIEDKLDQSPATLSGGQQQRVALGRSLVREPDVILLDEPLSSLDAKLRLEMRTELARIQQRIGTTFVHVTHNQEDAMSIADEILLLKEGRIQQFGDPIDLFEDPNNEFVADFIGTPSMNLLDATYVDDGAQPRLDTGGFQLDIPEPYHEIYRETIPAQDIHIGMRPNKLRPAQNGGTPDIPSFDASVSMVETFGDANWYYLDAGIEEDLIMKTADEDVIQSVSLDDDLTISVSPDAIHVFDPEKGEAYT